MVKDKKSQPEFLKKERQKVLKKIGKETLVENLKRMLLIRNFETRAESAYQNGKIGGFFHAYTGQEAIQTAALEVFGPDNWWITTYRCHALALLLGATPEEVMAELYGRETGNAKGRGGSMHLYTDRMLGGFGIVGGHIPVAAGAAFALKYKEVKDEIAICFLGDGAVAQGAFHETLNMASLWDLPCLFIIENNQWGMGTSVKRALCMDQLAEDHASTYNMKGYTVNGMDFVDCFAAFEHVKDEMLKTGRPILLEAVTERFKGHSISDPGLYRSKDELKKIIKEDPILILRSDLEKTAGLEEEDFKKMDKELKDVVVEAMKYADEQSWPDLAILEEDVFAP